MTTMTMTMRMVTGRTAAQQEDRPALQGCPERGEGMNDISVINENSDINDNNDNNGNRMIVGHTEEIASRTSFTTLDAVTTALVDMLGLGGGWAVALMASYSSNERMKGF